MKDNLNRDDLIRMISKSSYNNLTPVELNELTTKELKELYDSLVELEIANSTCGL